MAQLPVTDKEMVASFQQEYAAATQSGVQQQVEDAKARLVWSLVHSATRNHVETGLAMAKEAARHTSSEQREYRYLTAGAAHPALAAATLWRCPFATSLCVFQAVLPNTACSCSA